MSVDLRSPTHRSNSDVGADLLDRANVEYLGGHGFDIIFHLAALIDVEESQREPELYRETNVTMTENILREFPNTPVVFASTAAVYAASDAPLTERMPVEPENIYGETKLAAEEIVRRHGEHAILRFFNVAGCSPGFVDNHPKITHLVPRIIQSKGAISIYGNDYLTHDGTCVRDFIHVQDICDAFLAAGERLLSKGASLTANLGSGRGYSVLEVSRAASRVLSDMGPPLFAPRRQGDAASLVADITTARAELDFAPKYSLEEMIASHRF